MYPLDRRSLASHIYSILRSLRKVAYVLKVSHTTVSRWLIHPERLKYTRNSISKSSQIIETIKTTIFNDPFISLIKLKTVVKNVFAFDVSKELLRMVIKRAGLSRKKARFFSRPATLEAKTKDFIAKRDFYKQEGRMIVSMDETSFGRNGRVAYGYSPRGEQLKIQRKTSRMTTVSSLAVVSANELVQRQEVKGSFNTLLFCSFLEYLPLPNGTVILLDNVSFHHSKKAKEIADLKGFTFLFTPPYSPWFNPIEGVFSIVKRDFYKHGSIDLAYSSVTENHCNAFFKKSIEWL